MKILHLEDDPHDAALVCTLFKNERPAWDVQVARDRGEYESALHRGEFDLILSDFTFPGFGGMDALKLARQEAPEVPFIFLSGTIGEDRAIAALHAGAQDYVLKDNTRRLIPAIERSVTEVRERRKLHATELAHQQLANVLENTPDVVAVADPDGMLTYLNAAGRRILGISDEQWARGVKLAHCHPDGPWRGLYDRALTDAAQHGVWSGETMLQAAEGAAIPVSQVLLSHRNADGVIDYYSTIMRDMNIRRQAEALINGQKQVLEMIAGGEPLRETLETVARFVESQDGSMFCSILLLTPDQTRLTPCCAPRLSREFFHAVGDVPVGAGYGSCGTAAFRRETVIVSDIMTDPLWKDYRAIAAREGMRACWSAPIFDLKRQLLGTFAIYYREPRAPSEMHRQLVDIATHLAAICVSRHHAEHRIHEQADLLNKARDAIIVTDLDGKITFWNQGAERMAGWMANEALGHLLEDFLDVEGAKIVSVARTVANETGEWQGEIAAKRKDGKPLNLEMRVTLVRDEEGRAKARLSIGTDITEKKKLQEQFFRAQRLESIGMLAAGIAHDLNNILSPILLTAPMLRDHATRPEDLRMLEALEKSAERGSGLVRQILSFAQGVSGEYRLLQAKHLLRDIAQLVEQTFPKSIALRTDFAAELWPIRANPTQIHQVLLNLCVNARDAMPEGGSLTLGAHNVVIDELMASGLDGARAGGYLKIEVTDSGTGIPPEVVAHIWEPFFTTKEIGKGTGLGLSTVRGIVESHAGFVSLETKPGRGTTMQVYLPAAEAGAASAAPGSNHPFLPRGNGELILVVDDEASIRNLTTTVLARYGYRVLAASNGAEAIGLFAPRSTEISLVISDMNMPQLDGPALISVLRHLNSSVKILTVSGLASNVGSASPFQAGFLSKPFKPEELLVAVHRLLHDSGGASASPAGKK